MDLTIIYSKTSKGSRLRSNLFGGLSTQLNKVLALIDGKSNVRQILARLSDVSEHKLTLDLIQLERDGYIKQVAQTVSEDWLRVSIFSPMVVEEFSQIEEIEARAERNLKLEAEQKARAQMEDEIYTREVVEQIRAKEKAKAEETSRLEAEGKARQEFEEKARAAEIARIEKEHIALEQEELRKKMEVDAFAKEEEKSRLEAERKANQQAEIRQKAELRAREALDKIRAKEQATEQEARKKSEDEVLAKSAEKARLELEYTAQQEAATRFRIDAAAKAKAEKSRIKAEAEEIKHIEIARKKLEAEKMLKQAESEARTKIEEEARLEANRIAKKKVELEAQLKSKIKADQKARKEAEFISKKEEKAALVMQEKLRQKSNKQEIEVAQGLVSAVKNEKFKISTSSAKTARSYPIKKMIRLALITVLVYLPLIVLLLVGLLPFINLSILASPIQKLASESIGEQVVVEEVHASLWPEPHLVLDHVTVGASSNLKNDTFKINSIYISPVITRLFENIKFIELIKFSGINLEHDFARKVLQCVNKLSKAEHLKIKRVSFNQVNLMIFDLSLEPLEGEFALDESRGLTSVTLNNSDHGLSMQFLPRGDNFNIYLTATHWPLPFNPKIVFDEIKAKGTFNSDQVNISQIDGHIYGGNLKASAIVSWSKKWLVSGNYSLSQASTRQLLKAFDSDGDVEGVLNLTGNFTGKSNTASKVASEAEVNSSFEIRNGKINGIDLERSTLNSSEKSLAGVATDFNKLIGVLKVKGGRVEYNKLLLKAHQLQALGNLDILPSQDVSGHIMASLDAQSRHLQTNFELTGKVNNLKKR